jgi:hypothetical protein
MASRRSTPARHTVGWVARPESAARPVVRAGLGLPVALATGDAANDTVRFDDWLEELVV